MARRRFFWLRFFWLKLLAVTALSFVLAIPTGVEAHPHAWIDVRVKVLFDGSGAVVALRETWIFDEYYTAFMTQGLDENRDGVPDTPKLDALMHQNLVDLATYGYFTKVWQGDQEIALKTAKFPSSRLRGHRWQMAFVVPLAEPVDVSEAPLVYALYDPSFFTEMVHVDSTDAIRLEGAPANCSHQLRAPAPDPQVVMLAASLDITQSGGDGLGLHFAEKVWVRCSHPPGQN